MKLDEQLKNLAKLVQDDPNLNDEVRENVLALIEEVTLHPTPGNLRTLSVVFDKLGDATKYLGALRTMKQVESAAQPA